MPKTTLTSKQRSEIISLRETGAGWMEIERRTGVARRTALRVFRESEATKYAETERNARRQVASQEFERHMRDLIMLAESLVAVLELPTPSDVRSGDDVLDQLLEADMKASAGSGHEQLSVVDAQRVKRRNRLLLKALREHTSAGFDWRHYERWLKARNEWAELRARLGQRTDAVLRNVIDDELGGKAAGVFDGAVVLRLVEGLTGAVLCAVRQDSLSSVREYVCAESSGGRAFLSLGCGRERLQQPFASIEDAKDAAACCTRALDTIVRGYDAGTVTDLTQQRDLMRGAQEALVDALQELRLIPLILSTRCEFCPA